jgi:hypothetical protein
MILYKDTNYASNRLTGTIIMHKNRPVQVLEFHGNKVTFRDISTNDMLVDQWGPNFDITPPKLGYLNSGGMCFYVSRCPMRKDWKQGLRAVNIRLLRLNKTYPVDGYLHFNLLANTILGVYPSLKDAVNMMKKEGWSEVAFSRYFAIDKFSNIHYKGEFKVGLLTDLAKKQFTLEEKFFWVRESLEEAL